MRTQRVLLATLLAVLVVSVSPSYSQKQCPIKCKANHCWRFRPVFGANYLCRAFIADASKDGTAVENWTCITGTSYVDTPYDGGKCVDDKKDNMPVTMQIYEATCSELCVQPAGSTYADSSNCTKTGSKSLGTRNRAYCQCN